MIAACNVLDLAAAVKTWQPFPAMPLALFYFGFVHVPYNNRLYTIGGALTGSIFTNQVMVCDLKTNTWRISGSF
jgi:hypothetical protein